MTGIVGIVLAAGRSSRAASVKALAKMEGESLVRRAVRRLRDAGVDEVVVAIGPPHGLRIATELEGRAHLAWNAEPERGMLSSLQTALDHPAAGAAAASLILPVDHPRVRAETVRALVDVWRSSGAERVRPTHDGRPGHPLLVAGDALALLRQASPEGSPRVLLHGWPSSAEVPVEDEGILDDLDTAEALASVGAS